MRIRHVKNASEETTILKDDDLFGLNESKLTDEDLDGIKGGGSGDDGGGGRMGGDWILNHNETTVSDKDDEASLTDIDLNDEELDGIKGGRTVDDGGGGRSGGDWIMNHNETIASDVDDEGNVTVQLTDLPVADDQANETKGGPHVKAFSGTSFGEFI